jgi:DUF1009 family protein
MADRTRATSAGERQEPVVILAGGGGVPAIVAAAAERAGRAALILGLEGEADPSIAGFRHAWVKWGEIGRIDKLIREHGATAIVLVGTVSKRPDFRSLSLDALAVKSLPRLASITLGGDDTVLAKAVRFFEGLGHRVVGAHEIAPELVADANPLTRQTPSKSDREDIALAMRAALAIGDLDAGQGAVSVEGHVVALEGAEGTDAMLARVAELRAAGRISSKGRAGVLAKCAKPQQDLRVDMPTIGPRTVDRAAAAGLAGIAVEAGRVMIVERDAAVRRADEAGLFIVGEHAAIAPEP